MRVLIQRVSKATVTVNNEVTGQILYGLLLLAGFEETDDQSDIDWCAKKTANMRIFADDHGLMNQSVIDLNGDVLAVSQFTLHASTKKGNRPSFIKAAKPEKAKALYESFLQSLDSLIPGKVESGIFGADMKVELLNDGPVTIWLDSKNKE